MHIPSLKYISSILSLVWLLSYLIIEKVQFWVSRLVTMSAAISSARQLNIVQCICSSRILPRAIVVISRTVLIRIHHHPRSLVQSRWSYPHQPVWKSRCSSGMYVCINYISLSFHYSRSLKNVQTYVLLILNQSFWP